MYRPILAIAAASLILIEPWLAEPPILQAADVTSTGRSSYDT